MDPTGLENGIMRLAAPLSAADVEKIKAQLVDLHKNRIAILPDGDFATKQYIDGQVTGVAPLEEKVKILERKVDLLIDAISLNHTGHPPEGRGDSCWSCRIIETVKGIKVAEKLMEGPRG